MRQTKEAIAAMICITVLEAIALWKGVDGTILSMVIAVLAGLGGFWIGKKVSMPNSETTIASEELNH